MRIGNCRATSLTASKLPRSIASSRIASQIALIWPSNCATTGLENALLTRMRVRECSGGSVSWKVRRARYSS
jgi:hypothetical protein